MSKVLHGTIPPVSVPPRPLGVLVAPVRAAGLLADDLADALLTREVMARAITDLTEDSREVTSGMLFGAIAGDFHDGHDFVASASENGAAAALVQAEWARRHASRTQAPQGTEESLSGLALVPVSDTRAALGEASAVFFDRPAATMTMLGVTGTNGKTTTTFLLHHLLTALGQTAGLVGTVENRIGQARYATAYTTPEPVVLQRLLHAMHDAGASHVAMEVSSHGLALQRVRTIPFRTAVFTNLTHDHLDFHGSAAAYRAAKKSLFDGLGADAAAIVNADDPAYEVMVRDSAARVITYGTAPDADVRVEVRESARSGLRLRLDGAEVITRLAGRFNALNLAAAYAVGRDLGFAQAEVREALAGAPGVPGRFEAVAAPETVGGVLGLVDYAHTPDALDNVLRTARDLVPQGRTLHVVFGCGGDRDRAKRPEMARVAETLADRVIVTTDNPRTEDPERIVADIREGLAYPGEVETVLDRAAAIRRAAAAAASGDVIVVAGKGHETYQILGTERRTFDDREVLREALSACSNAAPDERTRHAGDA